MLVTRPPDSSSPSLQALEHRLRSPEPGDAQKLKMLQRLSEGVRHSLERHIATFEEGAPLLQTTMAMMENLQELVFALNHRQLGEVWQGLIEWARELAQSRGCGFELTMEGERASPERPIGEALAVAQGRLILASLEPNGKPSTAVPGPISVHVAAQSFEDRLAVQTLVRPPLPREHMTKVRSAVEREVESVGGKVAIESPDLPLPVWFFDIPRTHDVKWKSHQID